MDLKEELKKTLRDKDFIIINTIDNIDEDTKQELLKRKVIIDFDNINKILKECDIIRCGKCHTYRDYDWSCDFCDVQSCTSCEFVKNYSSWNISGCYACDNCIKIYCTNCRQNKNCCNC